MTRVGLTANQKKLFAFVEAQLLAGMPAPSFEEMREFMGLRSKSGIARMIEALVERGWLVTIPNRARSLALPPSASLAEVRQILEDREIQRSRLPETTIRISVPQDFARQLSDFCARRRCIPSEVILEVLGAHMRGQT
jgi:SOS-response transcriptional repressor LexA